MEETPFLRQMTPDDEADLNELVTKLLSLFAEDEVEKSAACTVMLHLIAYLLEEKGAMEIYVKELPKLWNMYKSTRKEIKRSFWEEEE